MASQYLLFDEQKREHKARNYQPFLTAIENGKGALDIDTVKGCTLGMLKYPEGGCYGECYAYKNAVRYGFDFSVSVSRKLLGWGTRGYRHLDTINKILQANKASWYRIGTAGDPCHDWQNTIKVCRALRPMRKIPVIVTKHWITLTDDQILELKKMDAVINTSTSGMDSDDEVEYRVQQRNRLKEFGIRSVLRVVSCNYGGTDWGKNCKEKQDYLMSLKPIIDNPLRARKLNLKVLNGDIIMTKKSESVGGGKYVSLNSQSSYLGTCPKCPDQCGIDPSKKIEMDIEQMVLFRNAIEFKYVKSVIGSGYEQVVAQLALEDGIAHRAARKNMQIHSAIILLINGEFSGFMTFQNNEICREFCLLQSVIRPDRYTDELYKKMVMEVIAQNTNHYPAIMTTDPRSKFETPELFGSIGFKTYLKMSGFHYMVYGELSEVRMKLLAHITMCNVWDSTKGEWLRLKKEWKEQIEQAGIKYEIQNPMFATRDGCWQGENGFANVVTGHSHNGNASVLDSVACEVILRFFIPKKSMRIYNPFGGGVQFGYVAGSYGYQYLASEIRKNQCDVNNKLCSEFPGVRWVQGDSSCYEPEGMFDLVFSCPPYFKVERNVDYDGNPPDGEINSMSTYEEFEKALFAGYTISINHLKDNCFFVIMTGDSRDKNGAYYCSESKTELFLKENGLSVYNKIIYLEGEFTRLAHAKKTLNMRKFPKREQKIIVAYKGNISLIKDLFIPVGRL